MRDEEVDPATEDGDRQEADHSGRPTNDGVGGEELRESGEDGVLTLVCIRCGNEYHFGEQGPPDELVCAKCGNTVFRNFFSPIGDEVAAEFEEVTARDLDPDDPEGDAVPGDVLDLNRP